MCTLNDLNHLSQAARHQRCSSGRHSQRKRIPPSSGAAISAKYIYLALTSDALNMAIPPSTLKKDGH